MNFGTSYNQVVAQDIFNGISDFTSGALPRIPVRAEVVVHMHN